MSIKLDFENQLWEMADKLKGISLQMITKMLS